MASANQKKATLISHKLKFLKDERDNLINAVEQYVIGIIAAGESWAVGGDNNLKYQELCQMIDTAAEFLCEKCEELTGGSMGVAANQHSQPSCEQPGLTSQAITATASTSATSNIQPAVLVQLTDETQVKPILARISLIEEALCSFRSTAEKVAKQQSGIDEQLKELLSTLSQSDQKHSSMFTQVKEQISEISHIQDAINQEQKTRLQSLERQLQKVSTAQDRLDKEMELQAELSKKLVHLPNQLEAVKENVDVLDARIGKIIDECSIKHENIKNVTDDLVKMVTANTHTIKVISKGQEQKMTTLRKLETRFKTLESYGPGNMKDFQKQAEKVEANLSQVIQKVAVMSPRLQQLELKASGTGFGFTASSWIREFVNEKIITHYKINEHESTVGNSFNTDSGIFTAPFDGLYVVSVSLILYEKTQLEVYVACQRNLSQESTEICFSSAAVGSTEACCVLVVGLKVGDNLFTYMRGNPNSDNEKCVSFTCFLLR